MLTTSFKSFDADRIDQIVETLSAMLQRRSIARELETLRQFAVVPEQVDELVFAAITTSLNLEDETLASDIPQLRIDEQPMHPKAAWAA